MEAETAQHREELRAKEESHTDAVHQLTIDVPHASPGKGGVITAKLKDRVRHQKTNDLENQAKRLVRCKILLIVSIPVK
jgi:hypothetical protein